MNRAMSMLLTMFVLLALTACEDPAASNAAQNTAAVSEPVVITAQPPAETSAPAGIGLYIENSPYTQELETQHGDDGAYTQTSLYDDMVLITLQTLSSAGEGSEAVQASYAQIEPLARDMSIEADAALSARLNAAAYRVSYETGSNEDTRFFVEVYLQTDEWDYRFSASTPIDWYEEYESDISRWIDGLYLSDAPEDSVG